MRFAIVTPCFNGARFIDETIMSVVSQAGPFAIRYHIQDGGSTDGTLEKLARWEAALRGGFPILCEGIDFSYASAPDGGMYGAINTGFERCGNGDTMSWINADDRFEPGAFRLVANLLARFPDVDWLCGRTAYLDEDGALIELRPLMPIPRKAIACGLLDDRYLRFIQQEGSFWRQRLWRAVGGLDARFRVAGDFDLWRRFAMHADLVAVDTMLGCFRVREGQASSDMPAYYAEIDRSMSPEEMSRRAELAAFYRGAQSPEALRSAGFGYRVLWRRAGDWACETRFAADPQADLAPRSFIDAVWRTREYLPPRWSVRSVMRWLRGA